MGNVKRSIMFAAVAVFLAAGSGLAQKEKPVGPKPVIEKFQPDAGPPGTVVDIIGKNFSPDYTVWLGATQVEVVKVLMDKLTVKIPDNAQSGRFVLKGKFIIESPSLFSVVEKKSPPKIDSFLPVSGSPGAKVKISGSNFSIQLFENTVMLGNTQVTVQLATPGELAVVIPKEAVSGKFSVTVLGGGTATSSAVFTVMKPLEIKDFTPKFGPPGTTVTLFGSGFGDNKKLVAVSMGGKSAKVLSVAPDKVVVEVPKDAISAPFLLVYKGSQKATTSKSFEIRVPPAVKAFTPVEGFPGTIVTILGLNFGSSELKAKVKLGSQTIKIISITDNKIEVQIPKDGTTAPLTVEITDRGSSSADKPFTVWVPLALTSFSPEKGEAGTIVKIAGQGFLTDVKNVAVALNNKPLQISGLTPTEISVKIPVGSTSGKITVDVKDRGKVETAKPFLVVYTPAITQFIPASGQVGQMMTVKGKHFGFSIDNIRVWIGPKDKKQFCIVQQIADVKLTCQIQSGTVTGPVTVAVKDMGEAVSAAVFQIEEPLVITTFSPASALPGTNVTIAGTGFSMNPKLNTVKLGAALLKVLSSEPHSLLVQIPSTLKAGGNFTISVKGKTGTVMSAAAFTVILPVKITKITPKGGPIGTTVKILGQGFGSNLQMIQVLFLGFYCPIVSLAPEEVQVQIPPGLTPDVSEGRFQIVVNPGGVEESAQSFKVTSKHPKIQAKPKK